MQTDKPPRRKVIHPLFVRITHWVNAFAMLCMITSGWKIYNASPIFNFMFPKWATLGGWLGGALVWHFAAMLAFGPERAGLRDLWCRFRPFPARFLPLSPRAIIHDAWAAATFKLKHKLGSYNAVQKMLYAARRADVCRGGVHGPRHLEAGAISNSSPACWAVTTWCASCISS